MEPELVQRILDPTPETASRVLNELGLDELPSREQIHREIQDKLLVLHEKLPDHWLPKYQMYAEESVHGNRQQSHD